MTKSCDDLASGNLTPTVGISANSPGSYMLLLEISKPHDIQVGQCRINRFISGLYCYVGSALGSGGLRARLSRHATPSPRKHWHIDYLIPHAHLKGALVVESGERIECTLAAWVKDTADTHIANFGASDCPCQSHLFLLGHSLPETVFINRAKAYFNSRFIPANELS